MAPDSAPEEIRITTVIDEFGATPTHSPVKFPVLAETEEIDRLWLSLNPRLVLAFECLFSCYSFARVLNHLFLGRDEFGGEDTEVMNARTSDGKTEAGTSRMDDMSHPGVGDFLPPVNQEGTASGVRAALVPCFRRSR